MYKEIRPKHLNKLVKAIWFSDSDVDPVEGHAALLDLGSQLVIKLYPSDFETVLSGPVTRQTHYPHVKDARYFGVQFAPGIGPAFDDCLIKDLRDDSADIDKVLGLDLRNLAYQLHDFDSWTEQSGLIARSLSKKYPYDEHFLDHKVLYATQLANKRNGDIYIADLARQVGISKRHLERLFIQYVGVTPKAFCTTLRIQHVLDKLQRQ